MKDSELHNFFKVAESRNISTVEVAEMLILNGRQIPDFPSFSSSHFIPPISSSVTSM